MPKKNDDEPTQETQASGQIVRASDQCPRTPGPGHASGTTERVNYRDLVREGTSSRRTGALLDT